MTWLSHIPAAVRNRLSDRFDPNRDRMGRICGHVDETDHVLDVGCVRHDLSDQDWIDPDPGRFLHADLDRAARSVVGLDIVEEEVERMNDHGYDVRVGNAESFDLGETFDVIVAGELIEHLSNPGSFLACCRDHIADGGKLILTTPNPRRFHMLFWFMLGRENRANREHTMWFDHYVIAELARREGFELASWEWYRSGHVLSTQLLYMAGNDTLGGGGYVFEFRPGGELSGGGDVSGPRRDDHGQVRE